MSLIRIVCFFLLCAVHSAWASSKGTRPLGRRDDNLPARVPYIFPAPGTDPIADAIRARRGGTLLDLDGVLLQARLIASGWNDLFGVIRDNTTLPGNMRELIILRSAVLNKAAYQWLEHESVGRKAGLTNDQLLMVRFVPPFFNATELESTLGPELAAILAFTDEITLSVHVSDRVFNALRAFLSDSQLVEAVSVAGGYAFVSRFVVALNVDGKMNTPVPVPHDD